VLILERSLITRLVTMSYEFDALPGQSEHTQRRFRWPCETGSQTAGSPEQIPERANKWKITAHAARDGCRCDLPGIRDAASYNPPVGEGREFSPDDAATCLC